MGLYPYIAMHFALLEQIRQQIDIEIKKRLCLEDISIYPDFCRETILQADEAAENAMRMGHLIGETYPLEYYKKKRASMYRIPRYPSFKMLAIIFEKEKEYDDAIGICKDAIKSGCIDDGTKGGMKERLRKLEAKKKAETEQSGRFVCRYKNRTFYGNTQEEAAQKMNDYINKNATH